jgi:hypothetical protein
LPRVPAARLVPAQPLRDVGEEPGLALLAVVDHVDPRGALSRDDVRDGAALRGVEFGLVDLFPGRGCPHQVEQCRWAGQAADVGGVDTVGAALHDPSQEPWG